MKKHLVLLIIWLLLTFSPAVTLAETINLGIGTTAPTSITVSAPEIMYPGDGHTLDLEGAYMFKVKLVAGASGYLFGLFQDGEMIYENWRNDKTLSTDGELAVWESNPFHGKFHTGEVKVMVRAQINGQWSDARTITIYLRPRIISSPTPQPTPTPSPTPTAKPSPSPTPTPSPTIIPSGEYLVKPYLIYPADKSMYPEYETAVKNYLSALQNWYKQKAGVTFDMAPLQVIKSSESYLNLKCGANPSSACLNDPAKLDGNVGAYANKAIHNGVENWDQKSATLIFVAGAGGYAGANKYPNDTGFAIVGDWVLEPLSGVVNDWGIPCKYSDGWQCSDNVAKGTPAHELGHAFGLGHPDSSQNTGQHSIMMWQGDYPNYGFLPSEIDYLKTSPFFQTSPSSSTAPTSNTGLVTNISQSQTFVLQTVEYIVNRIKSFLNINTP